jgi:hypothetical protein
MKWSAAQVLSWIIQQNPLELKNWPSDIGPKIEPAQKILASRLGSDEIRAWGRRTAYMPLEQIPSGEFRMSRIKLIVGTHGELATFPRHKISDYLGVQWHDMEFDEAEIKKAWPKLPPPSANEWMQREARRLFDHTGQPGKRDDLIKRCMNEAPCKKREAEIAFNKLPMKLRRPRGKPPKTPG